LTENSTSGIKQLVGLAEVKRRVEIKRSFLNALNMDMKG
jgi:hypothetical protein